MADHVFVNYLRIHLRVVGHMWTWSHNAHIAPENVEELGEFVNVGLPHEVAEREFSRVVDRCLLHVGCLVDVHGAEFIAGERLSVESSPFLFEKDGTGTLSLDDEGNNGDERNQDDAHHEADDDIEGPFDEFVGVLRQRLVAVGEDDLVTKSFGLQIQAEITKHAWDVVEVHHVSVTILHDAHELFRFVMRKAAKYLIYMSVVSLLFVHEVVQVSQIANMRELLRTVGNSVVAIVAFYLVSG